MEKLVKGSGIAFLIIFIGLAGCNNQADQNVQDEEVEDAESSEVTPQEQRREGTSVTLKVESTEEFGEYLVDSQGRSLYLFKADSEEESTCYDACAKAWPPLTTTGKPKAGEGVNDELISTFERKNGTMQIAYNGWPLYYYIKDEGKGQRTGQDVEGFGAEWYLVSPAGEEVHSEEHE